MSKNIIEFPQQTKPLITELQKIGSQPHAELARLRQLAELATNSETLRIPSIDDLRGFFNSLAIGAITTSNKLGPNCLPKHLEFTNTPDTNLTYRISTKEHNLWISYLMLLKTSHELTSSRTFKTIPPLPNDIYIPKKLIPALDLIMTCADYHSTINKAEIDTADLDSIISETIKALKITEAYQSSDNNSNHQTIPADKIITYLEY